MRVFVIILLGIIALMMLLCYSMLVIASEAEERADVQIGTTEDCSMVGKE